ncbi:hypothetical protein [Henriciella aquimarina]|uniref:hypothetical protein n=1 Tax=Henriciella aquimarina TaxID=545261 RepID=UPI0009FF60F6|nr:hypothetical protein [Henriciella aquimarina]
MKICLRTGRSPKSERASPPDQERFAIPLHVGERRFAAPCFAHAEFSSKLGGAADTPALR